jgi:hypothetical protein
MPAMTSQAPSNGRQSETDGITTQTESNGKYPSLLGAVDKIKPYFRAHMIWKPFSFVV